MGLMVESCTSAPPTRRSAKLDGLGGVFIILTSGGRSPSPVMGAQHRKELRITKSSLSFHQLRRQTSSMKTSIHSAQGRKPFLEGPRSFSSSLRMSRAGLGSLPRVPGRRREQLEDDEPLSRRQHRGLTGLLLRIQSKVDGSPQSAGRVTSSDFLPGIMVSQSDHKFKCEGDLRCHDGAGSDDFFQSELFHEASPRAGSNLLERSRRLPGRLLAEALSSMRSFLGLRGEADVSDQPRVLPYLETVFNQRYGKDAVGLRTSREMRTIAEAVDAFVEGNVLRAGDLLIQRFKALETSVIDGSWLRARHHELIPEEGVGLASAAERQAISRLELQHLKLTEVVSKK